MGPFNGVTIPEIQTILSGAGFKAETVHEETGLVVLQVSIRQLKFILILQGEVSRGRFGSAQCVIGFRDHFRIDQANRWNKERRFARVYVDDEDNPMIEMDFLLVGVTADTVHAYLGLWLMSLHEFGEMFG